MCGAWFESVSVDNIDPISGSVSYFTIVIVNRFVCWLEMGWNLYSMTFVCAKGLVSIVVLL